MRRLRRPLALLGLPLALALAGCGSSSSHGQAASSNPQTLLRQTFSAQHTARSGILHLDLVLTPSGSAALSTPIAVNLSGPFQSRSGHKPPESDLTITVSGLGHSGSFGIISTANAAFARLEGSTYALPQSDYATLGQSLSGNGSAPGLATLGIDPEHWLVHPRMVGTQTVDGTATEHVTAGVNVPALLTDINHLLAKDSSVTSKAGAPTSISPTTMTKIARAIQSPTVNVWTGTKDSTLRRLTLDFAVPVSGTDSARLGGLTRAAFHLQFDYSSVNASQTVTNPTRVQPYSALRAKLPSVGAAIEQALGAGTGASTGSTSGTGGAAEKTSKYANCISSANGDVTKMQRCAKLLSSADG